MSRIAKNRKNGFDVKQMVFFFKQKKAYGVLSGLVGSEVCIRGRGGVGCEPPPPDSVAPSKANLKIKYPQNSPDTAQDLASNVKGFASIRAQKFTFFQNGGGSRTPHGGWLHIQR